MARRKRNTAGYWLNLLMLGIESQQAIALRLARLSKGGPRARRESSLMVKEKLITGAKAGHRLLKGASATDTVKHYRGKVRANIRRLSK
jgi:hypothetical protein